jgi:hypothetical protein
MIELRPRGQTLAPTFLMGRSFNDCNDLGGFVTIRLTGSGLGEITMSHIAERLQRGVTVLSELQQKRKETGDPQFGFDVERGIIETELQELEAGSRCDPGTLEEELVRVRRCHRS